MKFRPTNNRPDTAAFTMVEIAICLGIIGFALTSILLVLPLGMNTQRDNREETIINQDATVLLDAVRNGTHGANDLTNYVYAITNYQMKFPASGVPTPNVYGYINYPSYLTNGANIIGLMSTPEFTDLSFNPTNNLFSGGFSN